MVLYSKISGLVLGMVSCMALLSVGCASWIGEVPSQLRVDTGIEPDKQDKYVRFRTTYYFRVVDSCKVEDGIKGNDYELRVGGFKARKQGLPKIVNDSLYRFRMSGQASALFNTIHFESGVLRAEQIDPFGSGIAYDKSTRTFRVEPASTRRGRAERDETYAEIEKLRKLYVDVGKEGQPITLQPEVAVLIKRQLQILAEGSDLYDGNGTTLAKVNDQAVRCPDGRPAKRSFYLYGPEGVRELDPDERLLMAMSSDSKPVISLLQQMSNKQLPQQGSAGPALQDLIGERILMTDAQQELDDAGDQLMSDTAALDVQYSPQEIAKRLVETFKSSPSARTKSQGGNTP